MGAVFFLFGVGGVTSFLLRGTSIGGGAVHVVPL